MQKRRSQMKEEYQVKLIDSELVEEEHKEVENGDKFTPTLLISVFVVLLASLSTGLALGYSSPVQSEIMKELSLSTSQYSLFGSIGSIGGGVGAILCGKLIDYLGRRRVLALADIFYILGWVFIAMSQDAWLLDLGQWMLGFATAVCSIVVPIYIAEFTPRNSRGGFVTLNTLMVTSGASLMFLIGSIVPWRTLTLIGIIPSLVQIISVFFIPESPRWLMMIGENEKFEASLRRFRGAGVDISQELSDIKVNAETLEQKQKVSLSQLFRKKYVYTLTVGIGLSALSALVGLSGVMAYSGSIFQSAGLSAKTGNVAIAIFQIPSVFLGIFLADKSGRRPLLMISSAGLCLGCMLTGLAFALQDHHLLGGVSPYVTLIGILVYVAAHPIGLGGVTYVIVSEIYPLNIKGYAGSVTNLTLSLSAWLVSYGFNFAMQWSSSGTFFGLAGVCIGTLIFVATLVPETKGKTLEEVHLQLSNVWQ